MLETYEQLKRLVNEVEDDLHKASGGNKAAGTRVRKQMQDVKNAASGTPQEGARRSRQRLRRVSPSPHADAERVRERGVW